MHAQQTNPMTETHGKTLTANDTGETGGHQGGICIPRGNKSLIAFFPSLNAAASNPDAWIVCTDPDGEAWRMRYVYYNGKLLGSSTRNEFRLTCMTKFFRKWDARSGDEVRFTSTDQRWQYEIEIVKTEDRASDAPEVIVLTGWRQVH